MAEDLQNDTIAQNEPSAAPDAHLLIKRDRTYASLSAAAFLVLLRVSPLLPFSGIEAVALSTLVSLFLLVLFTVTLARSLRNGAQLALCLLACGPLVYLRMAAKEPPVLFQILPGLDGVAMVALAVCVGVLVSLAIRETKILLPAAAALAFVDLYVVFGGGLVTQAQSGKSPVAQKMMENLTVKLATTKPPSLGAAPMQLAVGFADFLFIALFFACFVRFGVPAKRTFWAMTVTLILYMLAVVFTHTPLPALVPIGVVVIVMNLRHFRYERSEVFVLIYAGLIVGAILGAMVYFSRTKREPQRAAFASFHSASISSKVMSESERSASFARVSI